MVIVHVLITNLSLTPALALTLTLAPDPNPNPNPNPNRGQDESYSERGRQWRRTVFMHDDWVRHRSSPSLHLLSNEPNN